MLKAYHSILISVRNPWINGDFNVGLNLLMVIYIFCIYFYKLKSLLSAFFLFYSFSYNSHSFLGFGIAELAYHYLFHKIW